VLGRTHNRRRSLVTLLLLGLWLSGAVPIADACSAGACVDGCQMHRLVLAHQMSPQECGTRYQVPVLTVECRCGAIRAASGAEPAILTPVAESVQRTPSSRVLAALPAAEPHLPFLARSLGTESPRRTIALDTPARPGLRAPPVA